MREGKGFPFSFLPATCIIVLCNEIDNFLLPVPWSLHFIFVYIQYNLFAYEMIFSFSLTKLLFPPLCIGIFLIYVFVVRSA